MSESMVYRYINLLKDLKMLDIKSNNKFSVISIEKWEDYQSGKEEINSKTNNKRTTSEHKQEYKEIYLYLLNKYKRENRMNFNEYMKKMRELREDPDWDKLTAEEQMKITAEL